MMNALRKSVSGLTAKVLLGLVTVAFVVGGFSEFFQSGSSNAVLKVGDTEVLVSDYLLAQRQAEVSLSQQLQRLPTQEELQASGIEQRVMSQLVSEAVLDEQGRDIDLGLSEERLARLIADDPSFHDGSGRFSRETFRELLANVGMSENDFIRSRGQAAVRSQIVEAISEGATTPAVVLQAFGLFDGESRTAEYLTLPVSLVQPIAEPADDVLKAYFETNKQRYRAPEYRAFSYAALTPDLLADPAAVTDDDVRRDYERDGARFTTPERRRIQQIVYPDAAKAEAARAELGKGKTFEQLITESGRSAADADLGLLLKAAVADPAVADSAFALKRGDVSAVVAGGFGPVLLRVTEVQPESRRPLADVSDEIRKTLALAAAGRRVQQTSDLFEDARAGGATFEEAAAKAGVAVKKVARVSRTGEDGDDKPVAGLPAQPALLDAVFAADVGDDALPVSLPGSGSIFYDVTKIDPERERALQDVRTRVIADWKAEEGQRLLAERAESLKKRLDAGETLDQIAASQKLTKSLVASITRRSGIAEIGDDGVQAIFAGGEGHAATAKGFDGTSRLVIKVTGVATPLDPLADVPAGQGERIGRLLQSDLVQSYVNLLRGDYEVVSYPDVIAQLQTARR